MDSWRIWIDTGGTFTDCLAIDPSGQLHRLKILSQGMLRGKVRRLISSTILQVELRWPVSTDIYSNYHLTLGTNRKRPIKVVRVDTEKGLIEVNSPIRQKVSGSFFDLHTPEEVPVFAARLLTRTPIGQSFPPIQMKLGSTRGTNAILEKKGAKTALLITKGFKDLLLIGTQQRPELFALQIRKEMPLYRLVVEVDERMDSQGSVVKKWNKVESGSIIRFLKKKKIESIAVAFLNSYRNPKHEYMLKRELQKAGYVFVSTSQELSGQVKILQRAETTLANAYLDPIIRTYVQKILSGMKNVNLKMMTSAGGLVDAGSFHPKDSLLSGPAGGVVGAAMKAHLSGIDQLLTFDMGGTSTDVSRYDKHFDYRYESKVGTLKILSPSLAIETIAAGGGSICSYDDYRFQVGPESAGASPGPACYDAGGPLTITDVNLLLGRIAPKQFAIPLSREKAQEALHVLIKKVKSETGRTYTETDLLLSFIQIANEKMADAIRQVSTQSGHNPSAYTLLSFGGAGGQHACSLANMLGIKRVLIPYDAGLLSAYGIGHARVERFKERLVLTSIEDAGDKVKGIVDDLFQDGLNELLREGYQRHKIILSKQLAFIRFRGQESSVEIDFSGSDFNTEGIRNQFREQYGKIFGHWLSHHEIELESIRIVASILEIPPSPDLSKIESYQPVPVSYSRLITDKGSSSSALYSWEELRPGATLAGPALITSNNSTTVVDKGWHFVLDANNNATLTRKDEISDLNNHSKEAELELFTNRYTAVAREMGALLQRTSFSVNVKERLDFSCAVLDRGGFLVVNAPHIPVHLGSMGVCVREVVSQVVVGQGDVLITNHPAFGGSHLPDITLIKPVFFDRKLIAYVANRAHHAEIGGKEPGSMPADATHLEEEGVIILPDHLVKAGVPRWNKIQELFTQSKYPTRSWEENRADLNGALASVNYGERAIQELCQKFGKTGVTRHMLLLRKYAARVFHKTLQAIPDRKYEAEEKLDDGSLLKVSIQKKYDNLIVDFSGSSGVHPGNLNATKAIVQSVVLYVLRLLVDQPIPMNEGLMDHVKMILPRGLLNPDFSKISSPAVVGGNTEVSQRLTDTLLKALGLVACSQGTMNNFLFGNQHFGYYETICGGTGAGKGFHGADAVHQHMTNTRITDPELLELRYPVLLNRFEIRKNSGGGGKWKGGDGVIREVLFNEVLDINILSQHRQERPYGLQGGLPGKTGTQKIIRKNGRVQLLKGMDSAKVYPGDRLIIETPGGGGFGK